MHASSYMSQSKTLLAIASTALVVGCSGGPIDPTETPEPTASTPSPTPSATPSPTPDPAAREHCGDITTDEVWTAAASPHTITCDVDIVSGSVTIEAGALVNVDSGGLHLLVSGGSLDVAGTAEAPITLGNDEAYSWYGVRVHENAQDVSFRHTTIKGAQQYPGTIDYAYGPLALHDADAMADHLTIQGGTDCGLLLHGDATLKAGSTDLTVKGVDGWPVCTTALGAGSIPTTGADLAENGETGVYVSFDEGTLATSATWGDVGVPYVLLHRMYVWGTAIDPAILTVEAGVEVRFTSSSYIRLGRWDDDASGGLIVNGTAEAPVLFTGHDSPARGAWGGITSYTGAPLELHHLTMENAGYANAAGISMEGGEITADHLTLTGSEGMGISLINGAAFSDTSTHLTVSDCAELGRVYAEAAGSIPEEGVDLASNDNGYLSIEGQGGPVRLEFSDTWGDIGVDYKIEGNFDLVGTASSPTILTLESGVDLTFAPNTYLGVGGMGAAGLMAAGTADNPITFTSADSLSHGAWGALYFSEDTVSDSTLLEHVEVGYAGSAAFYRRQGSIIVDSANVTIKDAWIHHSLCNGIAVYELGQVSVENVSYSDMGSGEGCQNEVGTQPTP